MPLRPHGRFLSLPVLTLPFPPGHKLQNALFRWFRFLLLQAVSSINLSKDKFAFIPMQNFSKEWTDAELYAKYGLSDDEIFFIDSMMKEKQLGGE